MATSSMTTCSTSPARAQAPDPPERPSSLRPTLPPWIHMPILLSKITMLLGDFCRARFDWRNGRMIGGSRPTKTSSRSAKFRSPVVDQRPDRSGRQHMSSLTTPRTGVRRDRREGADNAWVCLMMARGPGMHHLPWSPSRRVESSSACLLALGKR